MSILMWNSFQMTDIEMSAQTGAFAKANEHIPPFMLDTNEDRDITDDE